MEKNTELDFFEQALKAFDAPEYPEESPESVLPEQPAAKPEPAAEPEKKPRRKWPVVLGILAAVLALTAILLADFGTISMTVASRYPEDGYFFGTQGRGVYYKVYWPAIEDVAVGSQVEVSYFFAREERMEDPPIFSSSYLPIWTELWAWRVEPQPYIPTVDTTITTRPPKDPEYTLTVSIFQNPFTALALTNPAEVSIKFSLSQEDAEALLAAIDSLEWQSTLLPEDYFDSVPETPIETFPTFPIEDFMDDLWVTDTIQPVFVPIGKFILQSDEPLYRDAYFSANGVFMNQGAKAVDTLLLYIILAHLADATEGTALPYELYVNQESTRHYIGFGADGASMYYMSGLTSSSSLLSPYGLVKLNYAIVEDILLMWPKDGMQDLYGFRITEDSLTFSTQHSHTTGTRIGDGTVYRAAMDTGVEPVPNEGGILFALPEYNVTTDRYDMDPETAEKLQKLLDEGKWEDIPASMGADFICEFRFSQNGENRTAVLGDDGYLYLNLERKRISSDEWEFLMRLMHTAGGSVTPSGYTFTSILEQAEYELYLQAGGTYQLLKNGEYASLGRYALVDDVLFLNDGQDACYLHQYAGSWHIAGSGIKVFANIQSYATFEYAGDIIDIQEASIPKLPADGSQAVYACVRLPVADAETPWVELSVLQIEELNMALQSQEWQNGFTMSYHPPIVSSIELSLGGTDNHYATIAMGLNGYLCYDISCAKLNGPDWQEWMELIHHISGDQSLSDSYQICDEQQNITYDVIFDDGGFYQIHCAGVLLSGGSYAVIGDVLYLDGKSYGVCYFKRSGDDRWEFLQSVGLDYPLTESP